MEKGNKTRKILLKRPIHSPYRLKKQEMKGPEGYKNPKKVK